MCQHSASLPDLTPMGVLYSPGLFQRNKPTFLLLLAILVKVKMQGNIKDMLLTPDQ